MADAGPHNGAVNYAFGGTDLGTDGHAHAGADQHSHNCAYLGTHNDAHDGAYVDTLGSALWTAFDAAH